MIFGFLVNMENTIHILIPPLGPLSIKNNALPMNSCFDLLPLQYTDLTHQIWQFIYFFLPTFPHL